METDDFWRLVSTKVTNPKHEIPVGTGDLRATRLRSYYSFFRVAANTRVTRERHKL